MECLLVGLVSDRLPQTMQLQSLSTQEKEARVDKSRSLQSPQLPPRSVPQISFQSSGEPRTSPGLVSGWEAVLEIVLGVREANTND